MCIFILRGPGSGKSTQAELLLQKYPGWVTIAMGDLLRQEVASKGAADAKWKMVNDLMSKGELVPEVGVFRPISYFQLLPVRGGGGS